MRVSLQSPDVLREMLTGYDKDASYAAMIIGGIAGGASAARLATQAAFDEGYDSLHYRVSQAQTAEQQAGQHAEFPSKLEAALTDPESIYSIPTHIEVVDRVAPKTLQDEIVRVETDSFKEEYTELKDRPEISIVLEHADKDERGQMLFSLDIAKKQYRGAAAQATAETASATKEIQNARESGVAATAGSLLLGAAIGSLAAYKVTEKLLIRRRIRKAGKSIGDTAQDYIDYKE